MWVMMGIRFLFEGIGLLVEEEEERGEVSGGDGGLHCTQHVAQLLAAGLQSGGRELWVEGRGRGEGMEGEGKRW